MTPYASLTEAFTYFSERYDNQLWLSSEDTIRTRALKTATRLIDRLNFLDDKTEAEQENEFPRGTDTDVPDDVKNACCEIAYALLDGRDPDFESEFNNASALSIGSVKLSKDIESVPLHVWYNIPSSIAWSYLTPYMVNPHELRIERVS